MNIILLSGGSGTRLWPLSNEVRSKQFLKILRDEKGNHESMVQRMFRMIKKVDPSSNIIIATSQTQVVSINNQLNENVHISIEPCRKDTFPAIALSVAYLKDVLNASCDDSVVVCPVDPLVDEGYFHTIKKMYEIAGRKKLTLMGIKPTYPSEKYGYILSKDGSIAFKEKPNEEMAQLYINQGALWNGGVFAFKISYILEKALKICGTNKYSELLSNYEKLNKISFDYAIAENEKDIEVVEYGGEWKDLGTWNTFTEAMVDPISKNVILGEKCENVHVINELSLPIVALGLKNVVVAASPDGILVSDKHSSSYLKKYVPQNRPMFERTSWGEYRVLNYSPFDKDNKYLVKELTVLSNKEMEYHRHSQRSETWIVVCGKGLFVINGLTKTISAGQHVFINSGDFHAVRAISEMKIIEVQNGKLLSDDTEKSVYDWEKNNEK